MISKLKKTQFVLVHLKKSEKKLPQNEFFHIIFINKYDDKLN